MNNKQINELKQRIGDYFYDGNTDMKTWTTYAPVDINETPIRIEEPIDDKDEWGWSKEEIKFVSLYEFLGKAAGKEIGMEVYNASVVMGVKSKKEIRRVKGAEGVRVYPEAWLEMWFRDYDAKLSMEVYNKERAKTSLKKIKAK